MKNKIEDLRNHLFAQLEDLRDPDRKFDPARTRAVVDVAQQIISSAKVEVDFINATGKAVGSGFIPLQPREAPGLAIDGTATRESNVQQLPGRGGR